MTIKNWKQLDPRTDVLELPHGVLFTYSIGGDTSMAFVPGCRVVVEPEVAIATPDQDALRRMVTGGLITEEERKIRAQRLDGADDLPK